MPFSRPTLTELVTRVSADFATRLSITGSVLARSAAGVFARVVAGVAHGLYGYLDYLARQLNPATAEGKALEGWTATFGITRKAATYSTGQAVFTGTDGSSVPAGSELQAADGVEFITDALATISGGTATAPITAKQAGATGNIDAGVGLALISPVSGVDSSATIDSGGTTGGADQETDAALHSRLMARIQQPPRNGAAHDYEAWAKEVAQVTRAFVFPLRNGPGTVGVTALLDGEADIIPDAGKIAEIQSYIDARRPVTADVTVFAPVPVSLDLTIKLEPNTAEVQAAVLAEMDDLIKRESEPDGYLFVSNITEAVSIAEGEINHEITSYTPAPELGRIVADTGEIIVLGAVTFESF